MLKNSYAQLGKVTGYTQKYYSISYPGGDVPSNTGACTDVVIRSFGSRNRFTKGSARRHEVKLLQVSQKWGLRRPDSNIDHRRVPNLDTYFGRKGKSLSLSTNPKNFKPGDVVAWDLNGKGMTHIGVVSNKWSKRSGRYLIIHNIGSGAQLEDRLFEWKIIGHYRYFSEPFEFQVPSPSYSLSSKFGV